MSEMCETCGERLDFFSILNNLGICTTCRNGLRERKPRATYGVKHLYRNEILEFLKLNPGKTCQEIARVVADPSHSRAHQYFNTWETLNGAFLGDSSGLVHENLVIRTDGALPTYSLSSEGEST